MLSISVKKFLFWKKKQLSKGGDQQAFAVLLDSLGGISRSDLNLLSINSEGNLNLKKNLEFLEDISRIKILPNTVFMWNNFLEGLTIRSIK